MTVTVCIGDSITLGAAAASPYPTQLGRITGNTIVNSGVGSETTTQMLARFSTAVLAHSPNIVVILGGINDIYGSIEAATTESNLGAMVTAATGAGAKVVLCKITPDTNNDAGQNTALDTLNTWIGAQGTASVAIADTFTALGDAEEAHTLKAAYDDTSGVHPNATGYSKICNTVVQAGQTISLWSDVNFWVASEALPASTDAAWSKTTKPVAGQHIVFDEGSVQNCSWDLALTIGNRTLNYGYSGTVTNTVDYGYASAYQMAGTDTGLETKIETVSGSYQKLAGTVTSSKKALIFTGAAVTYASNSADYLLSLRSSGGLTLSTNAYAYKLYTDSNKSITIPTGKVLYNPLDSGGLFSNAGTITSVGTGYIFIFTYNATESLSNAGTLNTNIVIGRSSTAGDGSSTFTLGSDFVTTGYISTSSNHATYTCTVDMAGKTLSATAITVSTRAILTNSGAAAACTVSGALTVSGASSVVSGAIVLTYGTYVQSNGTATQVGNWSGGNATASGGTLTGAGSASVTLTSSGDVNLTGATVTADKLHIIMTGAGKTLTTTATLFGLKASAYLNIAASCGITAGAGSHLTVDSGAFLNIANTKVLTLPLYADGATLVPNGPIGGAGTLAITMSDGDVSSRLGTILCPLTIASINTAAANRVLTVLDDPSLGAVTVSSSDDDKTTTLDFAGRSANISGAVTSGTRGNILWGEGVHHLGANIDTSAGAVNFETSQIVFTKAATLKTAAEQPFYDLLTYAPAVTLASDITVSNILAHVGPIIPGAFALTMTDPTKEYTGMRRPVLRNLRTPIGLPPCCRPLLDGIERVST